MQSNVFSIRVAALGIAFAIVAGTMLALGGYSDAKFAHGLAEAQPGAALESAAVAILPSRIDVVGTRNGRTRTAAHVDESGSPKPQS